MAKNTQRCSELIDAAGKGSVETVARLLESGVDPNCQFRDGFTPLMAAAASGHTQVVTLLLQHGADPKVTNDHGQNALMIAAGNSRPAVVEVLANSGADLNARNTSGVEPFAAWTALMHAAASGDPESVALLISRAVDINAQDAGGETALMKATQSCNAVVVEKLLRAGCDKQLRNLDNMTALNMAEELGQITIAEMLATDSH